MSRRFTSVEIDTTVKLWDYLYKVRMPYIHARSVEDIRMYGSNITGIPEIDRDYAKEMINCMINVDQMVEYYKQGVPIRIAHQSDVKEIYDSISQHLYAWKDRLRTGINIFDAPIEDLINLDKFANAIYEHAKYQFTDDILNSITGSHIMELAPINATNIFKPAVNQYVNGTTTDSNGVVKINSGTDDEFPKRESLSDYFGKRMSTIRRF